MGQQYSGGCIPCFDLPGTIHIKWFIVLLINHRPSYQQRMKSCMNLNFVYLCCINILICVLYLLSTCLLYLLVHDVVSILYMILCLFFEKKKMDAKNTTKLCKLHFTIQIPGHHHGVQWPLLGSQKLSRTYSDLRENQMDSCSGFLHGLVQECHIPIVNTLEILQSCNKPSVLPMMDTSLTSDV